MKLFTDTVLALAAFFLFVVSAAQASTSLVEIKDDLYDGTLMVQNASTVMALPGGGTTFAMEDLENNQVRFRRMSGEYIVDDDGSVRADGDAGDEGTAWTLLNLGGGKVEIVSELGSFLCVDWSGQVSAESACFESSVFQIDVSGEVLDGVTFSADHSAQSGNSFYYETTMELATPVGPIVFTNAEVWITYDAWGGITAASGTADLPSMPSGSGCGLWCSTKLGYDLTTTSPTVTLGFGRPSSWNHLELPLDPATKYFYLVLETGHSIEWGDFTIESPDNGAVQVVVDHKAPAMFFYTDFPAIGEFTGPVEEVGFGASRGANIPYNPQRKQGVEQWMKSFDGDIYLGGAVNLSPVEGLDLILYSDLIIDVYTGAFVDGQNFIDEFGYNGELTYGASIGPFSVEMEAGNASVYYDNASTDYVAFSGVLDPDVPQVGIPFTFFQMEGSAKFHGYIDENSSDSNESFLEFEGELDFGAQFEDHAIEGSVRLDENGGSFGGTASFGGSTMSVSGTITTNRIRFSGDLDHEWLFLGGKVEAEVEATFDSRYTNIALAPSLKFCYLGSCNTVGGSAQILNDGRLRVCATVAGAQTCRTL